MVDHRKFDFAFKHVDHHFCRCEMFGERLVCPECEERYATIVILEDVSELNFVRAVDYLRCECSRTIVQQAPETGFPVAPEINVSGKLSFHDILKYLLGKKSNGFD